MKRIAIVEDDVFMREELADILLKANYLVDKISDFKNTVSQLLEFSPDLILLDINLPEASGFQICQELKRKSAIPVLVLTSRDSLKDELQALGLGADEYLTKPCRSEKLLARISNVLKRYEGRKNMLERRGFLLDRNTYTLYFGGQSVILPNNQGKLLETLLTGEAEVISKQQLSMALWGTIEFIDENALQVNITRLKRTLSELGMPYQIVSIRGVGYSLKEEGNS